MKAVRDPVVQVLRPGDVPDEGADVVCVLQSDGWTGDALRAVRSPRRKSVFLVDTRVGMDMSDLTRHVDGISHLFDGDVAKAVLPLWLSWNGVVDDDPGLAGCVSREDFEETLRQACLPSSDPRRRD